uniref:Lectin n=1 Tax=Ulva pertusa TaxID=3120 RepID=LEC_ULVPE|nr:RecName: Full=Lectin; Flags: Precursor [Ulva pertusa]AAR32648.1 lectin [Ulva pertusa]
MINILHVIAGLALASVGVDARQVGVGADVLHAVENTIDSITGVEASHSALEVGGGITNTDNWETFAGLPLTGAIKVNDGNSVVHISAYFPEDRRGKYSYYAATSDELQKTVVFLFVVEDDGLLLQAVKNNAHYPVTNGMYLASHRYYPKDSKYEGMVRLMVHADPAKAVIWEFVTVGGKQYLKVKENRDYTALQIPRHHPRPG